MKAAAPSWSSLGSLFATAMVVRAAARDVLPPEAYRALRALLSHAVSTFATKPGDTIVVSSPTPMASPTSSTTDVVASLPHHHTTRDTFRDVAVVWTSGTSPAASAGTTTAGYTPSLFAGRRGGFGSPITVAVRCLRLEFPRHHRDVVRGDTTPMAAKRTAMAVDEDEHQMMWLSHPFTHPSTFDTLAMDLALRDAICSDMLCFVHRRALRARRTRVEAWVPAPWPTRHR
nr:unnamed protein product [Digitaria exilis]